MRVIEVHRTAGMACESPATPRNFSPLQHRSRPVCLVQNGDAIGGLLVRKKPGVMAEEIGFVCRSFGSLYSTTNLKSSCEESPSHVSETAPLSPSCRQVYPPSEYGEWLSSRCFHLEGRCFKFSTAACLRKSTYRKVCMKSMCDSVLRFARRTHGDMRS